MTRHLNHSSLISNALIFQGVSCRLAKMQDNAHLTQKISRPVDVAQQENACHRAEAVDSLAEIENEDRAISHDHHFVPD